MTRFLTDDEAIAKISSITGVDYSEEQQAVLRDREGMCVVSCAGSGKTTVLVTLIAKRFLTGEIKNAKKLLITTYSVAGREELEARLNKLLKQVGVDAKVEIRTLHSAYLHMLQKFGCGVGQIINGSERTNLIQKSIREAGILQMEDEDIAKIDSLISYQVNNMLTDQLLFKETVFDLDIEPEKYSQIAANYRRIKNDNGLIDYDDMQTKVFMLMATDKNARELFRNLWDYFYIDEFQDVSKIQFNILKMMLKDEKNLTVIGDDDQCIYKWRGADPNIILNICGYYDISRYILRTNYRCGSTIVEHAATCIGNNSMRMEKNMKAHNKGGSIEIVDCKNSMYDMSEQVVERIKAWLAEGIAGNDIAVLCRNNIHGVIIDDMINQMLPTRTSRDMRFGTNQFIRDFMMCLDVSNNTNNHLIVRNLWKVVQYLKSSHANTISHIMDVHSCNLKVALKSLLTNVFHIFVKEGQDVKNLKEIGKQYEKITYGINSKAVDELVELYKILCEDDEVFRFEKVVSKYLGVTINFLHKGEDRVRNILGIADYMIALANEKGIDGLESHIKKSANNAKMELGPNADAITLSTMHGSKGKEWKRVIIMADDNIAFPNLTGIRQMIEEGSPLPEVADYIEQERRLHYVAMTRAKQELVVFTNVDYMSVFMAEALGVLQKRDKNNTHIIEIAQQGGYAADIIQPLKEKVKEYIKGEEVIEQETENKQVEELNRTLTKLNNLKKSLDNYLSIYSEEDDDYDENTVENLRNQINNYESIIANMQSA